MKRYLRIMPLTVVVSWIAFAQETTIPIPLLNPGFEQDVLACAPGYYCFYPGVSGWLAGPQTQIFKPSTVQFPDGVPGGVNVAAVGNNGSTSSILQVTPAVVHANTIYTLRLSVGARTDFAFTGYTAALMAGNVTLAFDDTGGGNLPNRRYRVQGWRESTSIGASFANPCEKYRDWTG
jgi:hypothetical protein